MTLCRFESVAPGASFLCQMRQQLRDYKCSDFSTTIRRQAGLHLALQTPAREQPSSKSRFRDGSNAFETGFSLDRKATGPSTSTWYPSKNDGYIVFETGA
jgi:hypothetical protein